MPGPDCRSIRAPTTMPPAASRATTTPIVIEWKAPLPLTPVSQPSSSGAQLAFGLSAGTPYPNGAAVNGYQRDVRAVSSGVGCPECGSVLSYAEGCLLCHSCAYTKCG